MQSYQPSGSVAPGHFAPVIVGGGAGPSASNEKAPEQSGGRHLHTMKWGLVPFYEKGRPDHWRMFNARSETVREKTVFSRLLKKKRCVAVFDGFYEWKVLPDQKKKQPYYVYPSAGEGGAGNLLFFAALYDRWTPPEGGDDIYTFTVLTTRVCDRLSWLHDRQPVFLNPTEIDEWLHSSAEALVGSELFERLVKPKSGDDLKWHPVTTKLNDSRWRPETLDCHAPIKLQESKSIASFFSPVHTKSVPETSKDGKNSRDAKATLVVGNLNDGNASDFEKGSKHNAPLASSESSSKKRGPTHGSGIAQGRSPQKKTKLDVVSPNKTASKPKHGSIQSFFTKAQ